jgi:hypothetical protein
MPLATAVDVIRRSRGPFVQQARAFAVYKLAPGITGTESRVARRMALISELVGRPKAEELRRVALTREGGVSPKLGYDVGWGRPVVEQEDVTPAPEGAATRASLQAGDCGATFDPSTFVSGALAWESGKGNLELLPALVDPRGWTRVPFWLAATPVKRQDGRWVARDELPPIGCSWAGPMFEYVVFNADGGTASAFQVILDVDFRVTRENGKITDIHLEFSLREPLGNMQLMRVATGGMEIDSGDSTTDIGVTDPKGMTPVTLSFSKSVRFTDILTRSTPGQGAPGAGNTLNTNSPAMLAVWMQALVEGTIALWEDKSGDA